MSVYNGATYLEEAIESTLNQSFSDFEFLIIDDASTDESPSILQRAQQRDPRIRVLTNAKNQGLTRSLNLGIQHARGKYLARMDADDIAHIDRLRLQVDYMQTHPEVVVLGGACRYVRADGSHIRLQQFPEIDTSLRIWQLFRNCFAHSLVMMRTEHARESGYDESLEAAQDYDLWVRMSERGKLSNLRTLLLDYRVHGASISTKKLHLQLETVRLVHQRQLVKWGIRPSEQQLQIHRMIGLTMSEQEVTEIRIREAENWLQLLLAHNEQQGTYPAAEFEAVVQELWLGLFQRKRQRITPTYLWRNWRHPFHPKWRQKMQIALHTLKNIPPFVHLRSF